MPRVIKVIDDFRTNDLSFTPGGSTIKVINTDGTTKIYDKVKYPKGYCEKILKLSSTIDKIYIESEIYYNRDGK